MLPDRQLPLFEETGNLLNVSFPTTRFQGSKRKFVDWIIDSTKQLDFDTVLDVFGGTAAVSHKFKSIGKRITYNDKLTFNWEIGLALIQNTEIRLTQEDVQKILYRRDEIKYPDFIQTTFRDIFYYDDENIWLDTAIYNIKHFLDDPFKQALAYFALFQACIVKRPYNLFHRANLYMRHADVERTFGNKVTWDTPFETHFLNFIIEANSAVFDNNRNNIALNLDAFETPIGADLVYLDPPYLNSKAVGVDYREFYHFLEGIMHYEIWHTMIDNGSKHKRLLPENSPWQKSNEILGAFERLIERHRESKIVISYRKDGIPTIGQLGTLLRRYKKHVKEITQPQKYALSKRDSHEVLLIAY